jgi:hypothetical protein
MPLPQPMSATRIPDSSRPVTPSSTGKIVGTSARRDQGPSMRSTLAAPAGPKSSKLRPSPVRNDSASRSSERISTCSAHLRDRCCTPAACTESEARRQAMNTKQKIMALAALPLAGLLVSGGVAAAQTAGAAPGTQVVQQAAARGGTDQCPGHGVTVTTGPCPAAAAQQDRDRDRDCGICRGDHASQGQAATTAARAGHDGGCGDHGDR